MNDINSKYKFNVCENLEEEMKEEMKEEGGGGLHAEANINIRILNELKNMRSYMKGIYAVVIMIGVFIILSRFLR